MDKLRFGNYIYDKRKKLGLSQEELGCKLGVTNKAVSKWETGETLPDIQLLEPLAGVLKVSLDDLLTQQDTPRKRRKAFVGLISAVSVLSVCVIALICCLVVSLYRSDRGEIHPDAESVIEYFEFTPCYRSQIEDQTLIIYGEFLLRERYEIREEVQVALLFHVHLLYGDSEESASMVSYLNRGVSVSLSERRTSYSLALGPQEALADSSSFFSFEIQYKVISADGTLYDKGVADEKGQ